MNNKKNHLIVLLVFVLFSMSGTFAQINPILLDADSLIQQGISLYDQGMYDKAIEKYNLVNPADSDYFVAQYELSLTYLAKKDYVKTIEISKKAIQEGSNLPLQYDTWGTALDEKGNSEEAIKVYDMGISKYPYNSNLHLNKAIAYQVKGDLGKTKDVFLQLLSFSPFHASTHLRIARLCKNDGWLTQAMMAYTMFLIFEPSSNRSLEVLSELNKLCDGSLNEIGSSKEKAFEQEFEEIDALISNQVALNEKYKVPSDYSIPVIRQVYLLIDQLNENKVTSQGFFAQFYAPFFKQLKGIKSYETFSLLILASSSNEKYSKQVNKQIESIRSLRNECLESWRKLHYSYAFVNNGKTTQTDKWFRDDLSLQAFGKQNSKNENIGDWLFVNSQGYIECTGQFNNGKQTGLWTFFGPTGDTLKVLTFKNGKPNGEYRIYDKGFLSESGYYKEGAIDGILKFYYPDGTVSAKISFLNGKRNGPSDYYYPTGNLKTHLEYNNDQANGVFKAFHANTILSDSSGYMNDNLSGNYKDYYEDGKIARNFYYVNGVIEGEYKNYYRNGQIKSEGVARKGSVSGQWQYYYSNGKLAEKSTLDERGKITGDEESYDLKGRKYKQATYLKGELKQVTYFDATGKAFYSFDAKKKNTMLCEYDLNRFKTAEGPFKDSEREGTWKLFTASGALQTIQNYKNGQLNGAYTTYHKNGKIKEQYNFSEGNKEGLYKSFYENGILETEGNFKNDSRLGPWYNYFKNGKIKSELYYQDNVIIGESYYYAPTGKLDTKLKFNTDGILIAKFNCDTNGRAIDSILFKTGTIKFALKGNSGQKLIEGNYINGKLHGLCQVYYPNGSLSSKVEYFAGYYNGNWVNYYPNSKIMSKGNYFHGERNGKWEYFDYNGNLTITNDLINGLEHGFKKWYYPNGKIESEIETYEDLRNNKSVYYADNGDIREIRYYNMGHFVGYSYLNKSKEPVDTIFLKNGDGVVKAYYSNGNLSTEYTINNGEYHGVYKIYYPDGALQEQRLYENGIGIGPTIEYFNNGKVMSKSNYCNGELCGEKVVYNPNGTLRLRENYMCDELHGIAEYYDTEGKKVNTYKYYNGYLISITK